MVIQAVVVRCRPTSEISLIFLRCFPIGLAVKARRVQPRGLTLSQAGKSQPFAHPRRFFWFILLSFYPVDDGFWANGGARSRANTEECLGILVNSLEYRLRSRGTRPFPPRQSAAFGPSSLILVNLRDSQAGAKD